MITKNQARWAGRLLRWSLTVALIYGAFTETGHWTAASLFCIFVAIETHTFLWDWQPRHEQEMQKMEDLLDRILDTQGRQNGR